MNEEVSNTIEQIKRDPDYLHKARLLLFLKKTKEVPTKTLSEMLQLKPAYISHMLRLNKLPDIVIDGYYSKIISLTHLFIISRLKTRKEMTDAYEKILSENLTSQQTDELVRQSLYTIKTEGSHISQEEIETMKQELSNGFKNTQVKVIQTRIKAKIVLEVKGSLKETSEVLRQFVNKFAKG